MARGIKLTDTIYEVDNGSQFVAATAVLTTMLLRMDAFNLGTAKINLKKSATTTPVIAAHVVGTLNKNQFGIHPRYLEVERDLSAASSSCYGGSQKRRVIIVVPTLEQFNTFKVYDKVKGGTQADTTININHSYDGKTKALYKIVAKVAQELV